MSFCWAKNHDYGYFDSQLIERYVCLGDDFEDDHETSKTQGRFADITRSAQLFLHRPSVPIPLCIRDTPGVNDTFMVREQITIRAIRESRTCIVVLSAHQALSSVDMALIRLISNVKSREVIIFVNRIDELSDPAAQVPEIRESILHTLRECQGPSDVQILFGSAYWANKALTGAADMDMESASALENWAAAERPGAVVSPENREILWDLSGVPALFDALCERIVEGSGREAIDRVARSARNLCGGLSASNNIVMMRRQTGPRPRLDAAQIEGWITELQELGTRVVHNKFNKIVAEFETRVDRANESFLQRATAALIDHLDRFGDKKVWQYDPTGLRVLMRSAYQLFAKRAQSAVREILDATAGEVTDLYRELNLVVDPSFAVAPPSLPRIPPPVLLGQTIALDMQGNWWTRWWRRRRGYEAFSDEFYQLIQAETQPMADGLKNDHARQVTQAALATFQDFVAEQAQILRTLAQQDSLGDEDIAAMFGVESGEERQATLEDTIKTLEKLAA
ncbi:MAG: GTP-binding protein [Pseudomonadota bacterium]